MWQLAERGGEQGDYREGVSSFLVPTLYPTKFVF